MAEHPKNDEAAEIVGAWKPCAFKRLRREWIYDCSVHGRRVWTGPDFPSACSDRPDMRTPAMVVKMIEWLGVQSDGDPIVLYYIDNTWAVEGPERDYEGAILGDAVLLAVIATKESIDGKD